MSYAKAPDMRQPKKTLQKTRHLHKGQMNVFSIPLNQPKTTHVDINEITSRFKSRFHASFVTADLTAYMNSKHPDMALLPRSTMGGVLYDDLMEQKTLDHINAVVDSAEYENLRKSLASTDHRIALSFLCPDGTTKTVRSHQFMDALDVLGKVGITVHLTSARSPVVIQNHDGDKILTMGVGGVVKSIDFAKAIDGKA